MFQSYVNTETYNLFHVARHFHEEGYYLDAVAKYCSLAIQELYNIAGKGKRRKQWLVFSYLS